MKKRDCIRELQFCHDPVQRELFRSGKLAREWKRRYPKLFDHNDLKLALSQPKYHFFEWLAAVLLYESTGYLSLIEKYTAKGHVGKRAILRRVLPNDVYEAVLEDDTGMPDLFVYLPDGSDWHFCEVKGVTDRLNRRQVRRFKRLSKTCGKRVLILELKKARL